MSDSLVQPSESVTISGDVPEDFDPNNQDLYVNVDENQDGSVNTSVVVSDGNIDAEADTFEQSFVVDGGLELEDGDVAEIYVAEDQSSLTDLAGTLTVDGSSPTIENFSPEEDADVNNPFQPITVDVSDEVTANEDLSITVNVDNAGNINTYEINPETATGDGVEYADGTVTIDPSSDNVPRFTQDTVDVSVTVVDEAGNEGSGDVTFEVIQAAVTADYNIADPGNDVNDVNETVEVELTAQGAGLEVNDSTATLTITGPDGYEQSFDYTDDQYNNDTDTFSVTPDGGETVPSFDTDGSYTVSVSASDSAGNSVDESDESESFLVDTQSPNVTSVTLTDDNLNVSDTDENGEEVRVTFDESGTGPSAESGVNPGSVEVAVDIGGEVQTATGTEFVDDDVEETVIVPLDLSNGGYDGVENESAIVNVTAASDTAGNSLGNADADESNTTFAIDTDGPSVELSGLPADGTLSGYVNVTSLIDSDKTSDVDETVVTIEVGGEDETVQNADELPGAIDQNALVDITGTAENLTTQVDAYPDGTHVLVVAVQDDAGNPAFATKPFTLDNGEGATINQSGTNYLPGVVTPVGVGTSDVDVSEVFNEEESELEYEVNGDGVLDDSVIEAEDFRGQTVNVSAETEDGSDSTLPVQIQFAPLIGAESVSGDEINIGVETDAESLEELNVTVEDTDGHFAQTERQLTRDDFTEYGDDSGIYTADPEGFDDGVYEVTVTDAVENGDDVLGQTTDLDGNTEAIVDAGGPSPETAYVTGSDGQATFVRVEFNEVVDDVDAEDVSFDGSGDAVVNVNNGADDGILNVTLDGEVQTADAPLLNVSGVTEATGDGSTLGADASTNVTTASFDLAADGLNVISLPAEAGSKDIAETGLNSSAIETVSAYDATTDSFEQYSPGAEENDLTELEGGVGYVVNVDEDTTVEFNVQNVPSEELQAPQSQQISEGYNLIGHYQEGQQSVGQALTYLDATYDIERGYSGTQVSALEAGEGYWLFSNGAGTHAPVNYGGVSSEQPSVGSVQLTETNDDGVLRQSEQVEISATVQHDDVIDSVTADPPSEIAAGTGPVTLTDDNNDGEYTGTLTVNFSDDAEGDTTLTIPVQAVDVDGNAGIADSGEVQTASDAGSDDPREPKAVTNLDTGVEYNSLTAALNEAEEFQTLELTRGNFSEDRDSLTVSTNNLELVGQGEAGAPEGTTIVPELRITGDSVEVENISFEEINPSGDVTVIGDGVTLDNVNADNTITIEGNQASVDDSNATSIDITGSEASVSNSQATSVTIEADDTSVTGGSAETITIADGSTGSSISGTQTTEGIDDQSGNATTSDINPADDVVVNSDTGETFDSIQNAVDNASSDETLRVGAGTFNESVTVDTEGLTLEGPNAELAGDSDARGDEALINRTGTPVSGGSAVSITEAGVTVDGFQIESAAQNGISVDQPVNDTTIQNNRITSVAGNTFGSNSGPRATGNGITFGLPRDVSQTTVTGAVISDNVISGVTTEDLGTDEDRTTANGIQILTRQHNVEGMEITGNVISDLEAGTSGDSGDKRARGIIVNVGDDGGTIGAADGVTIADNDISGVTGAGGFSDATGVGLFEAGGAASDTQPRVGPENFTVTNNQFDDLTNNGKDPAPAIFVGGIETLGESHSVTQNQIDDGSIIRFAGDQIGFDPAAADALNASGNTFTDENAEVYYVDATDAADLNTVLNDNTFEPEVIAGDAAILAPPAEGEVLNLNTGERFDGDKPISTAVDNANPDDTLRVGPGTYTAGEGDNSENERTIDVTGLTLEGPNAGIDGNSSERGSEATINGPLMIGADEVTVDGLAIDDTDANSGGDLPGPGAVQIAVGGAYGDTADNATVRNNVIIAGTNNNNVNFGVVYGEGTTNATVTQNLFDEGQYSASASAAFGDQPDFEEINNTDETTG
ncbi:beta strand repeat-containing protein [Halobellus salinus]|uniref:beta strand repeat-containing protein n=1 Tax=Halobellus salinus TaxID=931585 RepID=UPI001E44F046|nr:hypothetical protein [Halobellus salinus]